MFSFGSDEGVATELESLESLVQRETGMSIALILESMKFNESNTITGFSATKASLKGLDSKVDGISGQLGGVSNYLEIRECRNPQRGGEEVPQ